MKLLIKFLHLMVKTDHDWSYMCLFLQYLVPGLRWPCSCPFPTCRAHVVSIGYLLQRYILGVKGLWWVILLLRVNHTWELGLRAHCNPSTLPLGTNNTQYEHLHIFHQAKLLSVNQWKHLFSTYFHYILRGWSWSWKQLIKLSSGVGRQYNLGFWKLFFFIVFLHR